MRLLNILSRKKAEIFIFALSAVFTYLVIKPILSFGTNASFFSIDPDVVYVANSLSYIKWHIIGYYDHPGVPSTFLIAQMLLPFRFYAQYLVKEDFFDFIFRNYSQIFFYLRIMQSLIFFGGLNIFLNSIYKISKSYLSVLVFLLFLTSFTPVYYLGLAISAETLNFLFVSVWVYIFTLYVKRKSVFYINLLIFLSGLMFANRATNIFYIFCSLSLLFFYHRKDIKNIIYAPIGFVLGIFPSIDNISYILKRVIFFASASGVHGAGSGKFFDMNLYLDSFKTFWHRDIVFLALMVLNIWFLFYVKRFKHMNIKLVYILPIFIFGSLAFVKFPLAHYQMPNFLLLAFMASILISQLKRKFIFALAIILIGFGQINYSRYVKSVTKEMEQVATLEKFVKDNPAKYGEVWEWARVKNYSYLWSNTWGSRVFDSQMNSQKVPIIDFQKNILDKCWDNLYIQKESLKVLTDNYPKVKFNFLPILNTQNIVLVRPELGESNPCHLKK